MTAPSELPLALTPGEPAGVGAEIALKAWRRDDAPVFFLMDDPDRVAALSRKAGLDIPISVIERPDAAFKAQVSGLPVLACTGPIHSQPGRPDPSTANAVIEAIRNAVTMVKSGEAAAVVTNPIQKNTLHQAGFPHPGHTEFLADLAGGQRSVMMLASKELRVVPVTIHEPIRRVPDLLTQELIIETARITARSLIQDFGIKVPRIAVAGLNPHAGEAGSIGNEDDTVIAPALAVLRAEGLEVFGPLAADSMFHPAARQGYDVALCMYHDQALIPIKTLDFWGGVNVTIGLPFVRTSPDHGTALDLAGTGKANEDSLVAALCMAREIAEQRRNFLHGLAP
ncbi:MAG: 4-hydroxythreonine-4-phosphate dehydrogenase PdxA [Proteobacteria bacterium]|nr:4-hydroxythreonine-4-phosphate dehydrogenase PdxA [Pseudomonadota bacterium]MDA1309029.1 4-hydroxythreonine-4-phosphate dehydrogenase PdxA [Pseudomonadota bacterium]